MQKSTFNILFYVKRNAVKANGKMPIMGRITVNGEAVQFGAKTEVNPKIWDTKSGKAVGKTQEVIELNGILESIKATMTKIYRELQERETTVSPERIKNIFFGVEIKQQMLLDLFKKHNDDVERLVGISKSKATYQKYEVTRKHLTNFIKEKYNRSDVGLKEIDYLFITDFEVYLQTTCGCSSNTTAKFMQFFKRIVIIAKNNDWIKADPFVNYKIRIKKVDRGYLTQEEVESIMEKRFSTKRLEHVRDIFVFSCFCGLAYIDVKKLRKENIRTSFDGNLWIIGKREKTDVTFSIPLLDIPKRILEKYEGTLPDNRILPVPSNQKMNAYLKEIGTLCGIDKEISFHLARHTFATLTLSKGVSIESVSKMLGHTNIRTTQIYARITDSKISHDMNAFAGKVKSMEDKLVVNQ
ncbi:site-specific recombinase XerD [Dysgonomonas sp. PFB1-18]|uniref:site-specific integrase n=1 Tax=unclassified Dysgonomonas TaxID=2630389 RepID=UPI0013D5CAB4|nr:MULTISPECIES: site-specific integrase [unclassified Dysgonomonas]MDH6310260.1 site-specific recombinase XerD [Dysgonomonas sp. PF1-14]MDH6340078.1 site-specific recombinase XerD [Dysgonomonas sp. PF1-16]MDH6381815.1 site-specific recombinase XerD [Dysgonomonas sp. PFB1-18]MDH6398943.1 site-specific recombinase XerD [Dysgonomonas sp. PF1-23]NDV93345.1 site-specific integrase [Dysgonomonas sp. 521]